MNYYNRKFIKRKNPSETDLGRREGGGFPDARREAMLKWQGQRAVKVFAVNLDILKNKIMYFWLFIKIYVN